MLLLHGGVVFAFAMYITVFRDLCRRMLIIIDTLRASLETQIPLGSLIFPRVSNLWGCYLNKIFISLVFLWGLGV